MFRCTPCTRIMTVAKKFNKCAAFARKLNFRQIVHRVYDHTIFNNHCFRFISDLVLFDK